MLYFYNILKDTVERKYFNNCPLISAHRLMCFIYVPSFMKIYQRDSKLLSRHDFQTEIFEGE